jgi:excisionase family DNA binding protein
VTGSAVRGRGEWLTLGEAARLLGVDETTLRSWADTGKIPVFRTPGGHRRFNATDVRTLLEVPVGASRRLGSVAADSSPREWLATRPWYGRLDEEARVRARTCCVHLMRVLAAYLEEHPARMRHLDDGRRVGADLGREVARWGLTPAQSTDVFLHYKRMVTDLLAAPPFGSSGQVRSVRDADVFLGEVLQAMMEAYEEERPAADER